MKIYGKRLRRLGTCFSLLSLSEKLLSVQSTKGANLSIHINLILLPKSLEKAT